ncbi:hypothetical protein TNCV_2034571 [Trichonephila clavipes]|nr:hypothetical protein TNCV_2034571 [Trichonephila clavipes]
MKKEKRNTYRCGQRTVRLAGCGMQPKPSSLCAQKTSGTSSGSINGKERDEYLVLYVTPLEDITKSGHQGGHWPYQTSAPTAGLQWHQDSNPRHDNHEL